MTRTTTSKAPGSGTSISSSWNASRGWPSRSCRITHAAIVSGSVPGSVSTLATFVTSIAIGSRVLLSAYRAAETTGLLCAERLGYGLGLASGNPRTAWHTAAQEQRGNDQADDH